MPNRAKLGGPQKNTSTASLEGMCSIGNGDIPREDMVSHRIRGRSRGNIAVRNAKEGGHPRTKVKRKKFLEDRV